MPSTMTGLTRLVPILAHPVDHVQAPRFYNPAFAAAGLDWCLVPMGVQPPDLSATLAQLARVGNLQGVNLTIPHKAAGHALCRWLGPEARRTGVVNSLRLTPEGHWVGESFDGQGFVDAARFHGLLPPSGRACIVGAGGAGTAIAFALAAAGLTSIHLIDTDRARADSLAGRLREAWPALEVGTGDDAADRSHQGFPGDQAGANAAFALGQACRLRACSLDFLARHRAFQAFQALQSLLCQLLLGPQLDQLGLLRAQGVGFGMVAGIGQHIAAPDGLAGDRQALRTRLDAPAVHGLHPAAGVGVHDHPAGQLDGRGGL